MTDFLFVAVCVVLALVGSWLVRRRFSLTFLRSHHDVAGFMIGVIGVIYGILLSFAVVVVWERYDKAKATVAQEGNQISDLARLAQGLPGAAQGRLHAELAAYLRTVINHEWPAMVAGQKSSEAQAAVSKLWAEYLTVEPKTERESAVYAESLSHLNNLSDSRRQRLFASTERMPMVFWILLWGGGVITLLFTYFFGVESLASQALMTAGLTCVIALVLVLIVALNQPFEGLLKIPPTPLHEALTRITEVGAAAP